VFWHIGQRAGDAINDGLASKSLIGGGIAARRTKRQCVKKGASDYDIQLNSREMPANR